LNYSKSLDGLRGIAILLVCFYHWNVPGFRGGFFGVDIFFVLSGYLITSILLKEYQYYNNIDFKKFYFRRMLRLCPAFIFLLSVYMVIACFLNNTCNHVIDILIALFYVSNWSLTRGTHQPKMIGHTWSLSIEEQFYILWPLSMYVVLKKFGPRVLLIGTFLLALASTCERGIIVGSGYELSYPALARVYFALDTRIDCLLYGCLLGIFIHYSNKFMYSKHICFLLQFMGWLGIVFIVVSARDMEKTWVMRYGVCLVAFSTICLLLSINMPKENRTINFLSSSIFVWFGKRSYGLYLWHYFVIKLFDLIKHINGRTVLAAITAIIITEISYRWIEKPTLALKDRIRFKSNVNQSLELASG